MKRSRDEDDRRRISVSLLGAVLLVLLVTGLRLVVVASGTAAIVGEVVAVLAFLFLRGDNLPYVIPGRGRDCLIDSRA